MTFGYTRRFLGGMRTHDVALAHDHLARMHVPPRLLGAPWYPEREVLRRFLWGRSEFTTHPPPLSMLEHGQLSGVGPRSTTLELFPAANTERVTWFEPVNRRGIVPRPAASVFAQELVRTRRMSPGTGVLEAVATWLRAQALDNAGAPVGPVFETGPASSPFPFPLIHPGGLGDLSVAWILMADLGTNLPDNLIAAPLATLPLAEGVDGIPLRWADNRYSWGGQYTLRHYIVIPEGAALRLFVEVSAPDAQFWTVQAAGLLSGHFRIQGAAGSKAAVTR